VDETYLRTALGFDPAAVLDSLQSVADVFASVDGNRLVSTKMPFINKSLPQLVSEITGGGLLGEGLASFFQNIASRRPVSASAFDAAVRAAQGVLTGAEIKANPNGRADQHDLSQGKARYLLTYRPTMSATPVGFELGLPLLDLQAEVNVGPTVDVAIEFGLNPEQGFYLIDRPGPEVSFTLGVDARLDAAGSFGPLAIGVVGGRATLPNARLELDLVDADSPLADANRYVLPSEVFASLRPNLTLERSAELKLPLGARLGDGGPGVVTEFTAHWDPFDTGSFTFGPRRSSDPADGFGPLKYELG